MFASERAAAVKLKSIDWPIDHPVVIDIQTKSLIKAAGTVGKPTGGRADSACVKNLANEELGA